MKMNKKGFTLIEMLVVIAIIAVLVSIIIPTVSSATTKAAAATNAANLRAFKAQLVTASLAGDVTANKDASGNIVSYTDGVNTFTAPEYKKVSIISGITDGASATAVQVTTGEGANQVVTDEWNVYFGSATYNIEYFAEIAETGKAPTAGEGN